MVWLITALTVTNLVLLVAWLRRGTCACGAAALHDCEVCHDDLRTRARGLAATAAGEVCKMNSYDWT